VKVTCRLVDTLNGLGAPAVAVLPEARFSWAQTAADVDAVYRRIW